MSYASASPSSCVRHATECAPMPCIKTSGAPCPARRYAIRTPRTATCPVVTMKFLPQERQTNASAEDIEDTEDSFPFSSLRSLRPPRPLRSISPSLQPRVLRVVERLAGDSSRVTGTEELDGDRRAGRRVRGGEIAVGD